MYIKAFGRYDGQGFKMQMGKLLQLYHLASFHRFTNRSIGLSKTIQSHDGSKEAFLSRCTSVFYHQNGPDGVWN